MVYQLDATKFYTHKKLFLFSQCFYRRNWTSPGLFFVCLSKTQTVRIAPLDAARRHLKDVWSPKCKMRPLCAGFHRQHNAPFVLAGFDALVGTILFWGVFKICLQEICAGNWWICSGDFSQIHVGTVRVLSDAGSRFGHWGQRYQDGDANEMWRSAYHNIIQYHQFDARWDPLKS